MQIINSIFEEFILECTVKGLKPITIKTYTDVWRRFISRMAISNLSDLTTGTVKVYKMKMVEEGLSPHTVNSNLRHLKAIFNWMADEDQQIIPPIKIKLVKAPVKIKDIYNNRSLKQLLQKPTNDSSFVTWRSWLVSTILAETGMRGATLIMVEWSDIDIQLKQMNLNDTKNDARVIPLSDELNKALLVYKRKFTPSPTSYLISSKNGSQIKMRSLQDTMKTYHNSRGVQTSSLHQYRRTFITNALLRGVDSLKVARMVGHHDLQMINKHYLPHQVELLRSVVE